jgi:hypothetical protein
MPTARLVEDAAFIVGGTSARMVWSASKAVEGRVGTM